MGGLTHFGNVQTGFGLHWTGQKSPDKIRALKNCVRVREWAVRLARFPFFIFFLAINAQLK
jgi:hypothetical protein